MSIASRVIWSEGMFLRPQHFQQEARYFERVSSQRTAFLTGFGWGFSRLEFDRDLLTAGRLRLSGAAGIFQDGAVFDVPDHDIAPPELHLTEEDRGKFVYLCLSLFSAGDREVGFGRTNTDTGDEGAFRANGSAMAEAAEPQNGSLTDDIDTGAGLARWKADQYTVADVMTAAQTERSSIEIAKFCLHLRTDSAEAAHLNGMVALPLARIADISTDGAITLDAAFVPPVLDCAADPAPVKIIEQAIALCESRAKAIAERMGDTGRIGSADVADFLILQLINKYIVRFRHLASRPKTHPETLYLELVSACGELSVYSNPSRMAPQFSPYRHGHIWPSLKPVIDEFHRALRFMRDPLAVKIDLLEKRFGIRVGAVPDVSLFDRAQFVMAVAADLPSEDIRQRIPVQTKVSAVEKIHVLINNQLPGVRIRALPVAPQQIPFHSGKVYFELERGGEQWEALPSSAGLALHVGGGLPGVDIELWAIREATQ